MVPVAFNTVRLSPSVSSTQIPLSKNSEDVFCYKKSAMEELLYLMTCQRAAVFRSQSQADFPSLSSVSQH